MSKYSLRLEYDEVKFPTFNVRRKYIIEIITKAFENLANLKYLGTTSVENVFSTKLGTYQIRRMPSTFRLRIFRLLVLYLQK
jgi:hypothetical protein